MRVKLSILSALICSHMPFCRVSAGGPEHEPVFGLVRARIVLAAAQTSVEEPRTRAVYRTACIVETEDRTGYARRFVVHAPESSALPYARRAARMLALIWGMADTRFGSRCARLRT